MSRYTRWFAGTAVAALLCVAVPGFAGSREPITGHGPGFPPGPPDKMLRHALDEAEISDAGRTATDAVFDSYEAEFDEARAAMFTAHEASRKIVQTVPFDRAAAEAADAKADAAFLALHATERDMLYDVIEALGPEDWAAVVAVMPEPGPPKRR